MTTPNAELAYKVLDHIDANPETWEQDRWVTGCGTSFCFAGWALTLSGHELADITVDGLRRMRLDANTAATGGDVSRAAARELGISDWIADAIFEPGNTREDLADWVTDTFGPRPGGCGVTGDEPNIDQLIAASDREQLLNALAGAKPRSLHPTKHVQRVRAFRWRWWLTDAGTPAPDGYALTQTRAWSRAHKAATRIHRERTEAEQ